MEKKKPFFNKDNWDKRREELISRHVLGLDEDDGTYEKVVRWGMDMWHLAPGGDVANEGPHPDYLAALDWAGVYNAGLEPIFERCDAILCPATLGPAPMGLESTGDAIFNGLWTLCGTPAVTLPLFESSDGMPMGVQLVGRRGDDARLLRTARWLMERAEAVQTGETE